MPAGSRLRNLPISALPTHVQENVVARSVSRQYTGNLLARAVLRQICQDIVEDIVDAVEDIVDDVEHIVDAVDYIGEAVEDIVEDNVDDVEGLLSMPRLRLMSGEEITVQIPGLCSTHDFYQLSRATLNLGRSTSLALMRMGPGSFEGRLLPCVRWESSHLIKRRVFQVVTHK